MGFQAKEGSKAVEMMKVTILFACLVGMSVEDFVGGIPRSGRQEDDGSVQGGIDFSGCQEDPETGLCCVEKEEQVTTLKKDPILECTHKNVEQCHYTYVTQFKPSQEEVCEENFEKQCSITFKQQAYNETVRKCYRPVEKVCNGQGEEECRTVYESSCTTKYVEKQPGKFVGDTGCEKLPIEICGAGCTFEEGPKECHDKVLVSLVDVPEEICDLNPQKTCRFVTKLVPKLKPEHQCTIVPKETCTLKFTQPQQVEKPLLTKWCLDPTPVAPGESYSEDEAQAPPIGGSESAPQPAVLEPEYEPEIPAYQAEESIPLDTSYLSPGTARSGRNRQFSRELPALKAPARRNNGQRRNNFGTSF